MLVPLISVPELTIKSQRLNVARGEQIEESEEAPF